MEHALIFINMDLDLNARQTCEKALSESLEDKE